MDFNDDVWNEIKSYVGIYNITTEWDKLGKVGASRLNEYYEENYRLFGCRYLPVRSKKPDEMRKFIYKNILKRMTFEEATKLCGIINFKLQLKIGDEITCYEKHKVGKGENFSGIVIKVNKCSVVFKPYKLMNLPITITREGFPTYMCYYRYVWDKDKFDETKTTKNFKCKGYEGFNPDYYDTR